jgi:uridine phosphorylase
MYQTLIGGAGTVGLFEEVIVKGGKKFLAFGSCGSLDKNISEGHLIVPTQAYRDEGISYHYMPESDYVEVRTSDKLAEIFDEMKLPYIKAKTWTTDALYRETERNMKARKKEGCLTVDMECASIMAASNFRNIPVYQFLYAEDNLDSIEWEARSMGKVSQNEYEKYLDIALEVASRL